MAWVVVDTPDAISVQRWMMKWTDDLDWETHTVLDDEDVGTPLAEQLSA